MSASNGASRGLSVGIVGAGFGGIGIGDPAAPGRDRATSRSSSAATRSAASGARTPTPAPPATCPPTSTRSRSRPGHDWSRRYAPQAEILAYLERVHARATASARTCASAPRSRRRRSTPRPGAGRSRPSRRAATSSTCSSPPAGSSRAPRSPRSTGIDDFEGPRLPLGRVGPRRRPDRAQGRGRRHRRERDPVRPRDRAEVAAATTIYQRSAPWILPKSDRAYPEWERRLFRALPAARRRQPARDVRRSSSCATYGVHRHRLGAAPVRADRRPRARKALARPRAARQGDARLRDRLQADPDHERLVPDPAAAPTSSSSPAASSGSPPTAWSAPTASSGAADTIIWGTGFQTHNFVAPMEVRGLGGRELNEVWAGTRRGLPGHHRLGLPEHVRALRPEHEPRLGLGAVHARVPVQLRLDAVRRLRDGGFRWIDLRPETQAALARGDGRAQPRHASGWPAAATTGT